VPEEKTEFHGDVLRDYQGRSYIHIPSDMKLTPPERCYVPKKWIHTWYGIHSTSSLFAIICYITSCDVCIS
jgi:hypothetical protein